jgi:hypothetical protein
MISEIFVKFMIKLMKVIIDDEIYESYEKL